MLRSWSSTRDRSGRKEQTVEGPLPLQENTQTQKGKMCDSTSHWKVHIRASTHRLDPSSLSPQQVQNLYALKVRALAHIWKKRT